MKTSQHVGLKGIDMKEEWLMSGAAVPVDVETTAALVAEVRRLIDVVGGLILKQGPDYERGFIDGMQKQMQSSVDKAVNAMTQPTYYIPNKDERTWVGLTDDEVYEIAFTLEGEHWKKIANAFEAKLKEKNT